MRGRERGGSVTAADYFQPFRIHYRGSILLCLKSTTGQCIIRKWSRAGDRSETPLLPALLPILLFHSSPSSFQPLRFFFPVDGERRNAGGSVGISLSVPRWLSQTYKSNPMNKSLRRSHGGSRRSSYSPSYSSSAFAQPLTRFLLPTRAFLLSCTFVGIMRHSRKETEVLLDFLNPKLVSSSWPACETLLFHCDISRNKKVLIVSSLFASYDILRFIFPLAATDKITCRPRSTSRYSLLNLFRQLPVFLHQIVMFCARSFFREIRSL